MWEVIWPQVADALKKSGWAALAAFAAVIAERLGLPNPLGPDVNIANVMPDDLIETEALRVGLGVVGPSRRAG